MTWRATEHNVSIHGASNVRKIERPPTMPDEVWWSLAETLVEILNRSTKRKMKSESIIAPLGKSW